MKRLTAFIAATVAAMSLATAEITIGGRGIFGLGVGTSYEGGADNSIGNSFDFGGAAFVKVPVWESLSIQPEVGFTYNMLGWELGSGKGKSSYKAIDVPVLVGWDFKINDDFTVTPVVGPRFSIPVGKPGQDLNGGEFDSFLQFSIVAGAGVAYRLGPGALVGDLRYNLGITGLQLKNVGDFVTPRAFQLSVGYQYQLDF